MRIWLALVCSALPRGLLRRLHAGRWALGGLAAVLAASAWAQVEVPVAAVEFRAVSLGFELEGVVQPVQQSTLSAQTAGRVTRLAVKAGDFVRAGQLLVAIDDQEAQAEVQRSQAQATQAQAQWVQAQRQFERTRNLQKQGFVSAAALDAARAQFEVAQAGRDQARAAAKRSLLARSFTQVTAPFEGWVLQTEVQLGELALPGRPLLTLSAPLPLRVVAQVPLSRSAQLGTAEGVAQIQIPLGEGGYRWMRPVAQTRLPTSDPVAQTVEWRFDLPDEAADSVLAGQSLRLRLQAGNVKVRRLMLPASAVLRRGELTAVYLASAQGFVLRAVRLGADHGEEGVEVLAGLSAKDRVALDPIKAGLAGAKPAR